MALRDVNLLPAALLYKRSLVRHACAWSLAYLLLLGIVGGAAVGYTGKTVPRQGASVNEEQVRKQIAAVLADIQRKKEALEQLTFVRQAERRGAITQVLKRPSFSASSICPDKSLVSKE